MSRESESPEARKSFETTHVRESWPQYCMSYWLAPCPRSQQVSMLSALDLALVLGWESSCPGVAFFAVPSR